MRVVVSPQTVLDLEEIGDYIARDNPRRAVTCIDEIQAKCLRLGEAPEIGTARPELGEGVRVLPHGRYLIFYRKHDETLRIERVLHGSRDINGDEWGLDSQGQCEWQARHDVA